MSTMHPEARKRAEPLLSAPFTMAEHEGLVGKGWGFLNLPELQGVISSPVTKESFVDQGDGLHYAIELDVMAAADQLNTLQEAAEKEGEGGQVVISSFAADVVFEGEKAKLMSADYVSESGGFGYSYGDNDLKTSGIESYRVILKLQAPSRKVNGGLVPWATKGDNLMLNRSMF